MSGLHKFSYAEWGDNRNPRVLICAHGLTRSGRDFEPLARQLASEYRVICPDYPGRGRSDWLRNPEEYQVATYLTDTVTLIARLDVQKVDWLGTSMGGMIGMCLAALPGNPIRRLILNDVGPRIEWAALERIGQYLGGNPQFPSFAAAEQYVRAVCTPFGPHTDPQWRFLTEVVTIQNADGTCRLHYDPAIGIPFRSVPQGQPIDLWNVYDAIHVPTLVIRGAQSDLLTKETAQAMTQRGPRASVVELEGIGHAPTLMTPEEIDYIAAFLQRPI
jgi:pimeloyl-ACP methyl ester carboxylesterase